MIREAINELKKYTLGKKNTEKVEISVLQLNRVIKALEQESVLDKEEIIKKLKDARSQYPTTVGDKIYDAVTIDEGISEVIDFGMGKGLEMAILIIEADKGRN